MKNICILVAVLVFAHIRYGQESDPHLFKNGVIISFFKQTTNGREGINTLPWY